MGTPPMRDFKKICIPEASHLNVQCSDTMSLV